MAHPQKSMKTYTMKQLMEQYGFSKTFLHRHFPHPRRKEIRGVGTTYVWTEDQLRRVLNSREAIEYLKQRNEEADRKKQMQEIRSLLSDYTPEYYIDHARKLSHRVFVLHVGPTNSGKTFDAMEDLKANTPGTYLGPLRLLALEMADKLNAAGIPTSMITGEETILAPDAVVISSTIELCNYEQHFRTAVIDEAQLIADPDRGSSWLKALCLVNADVVHVCMAPEARSYIEGLIKDFGAEYVVREHQRLAPLVYGGACKGIRDLREGDAVISFSRKSVLSTAAQLEKKGFRASVIYGALPPEARRNEVRKYMSGQTNIVCATDAIGLGISLPISRVIFAESQKFDGKELRRLTVSEVRQIGGRAGRFGLKEKGEVLHFGDAAFIGHYLNATPPKIRACCISFPRETLQTDYPLDQLFRVWQGLNRQPGFVREDMKDALILYGQIQKQVKKANRDLIYDLITCPVDTRSTELVGYWAACALAILKNRAIPQPYFGTESLQACELQYRAYDIHHQLLRRIGREDDCTRERQEICEKIARFMAASKDQYIRRCRVCGRELPIGYAFNTCEHCFSLGAVHNGIS